MAYENYDSDDDFFMDDEDDFYEQNVIENILNSAAALFDTEPGDGLFIALTQIAKHVNETHGQAGLYSMLCAVESQTGWSLEIIGSKKDIEQALWHDHNAYVEDAWIKARNSAYWDLMVHDVYKTSIDWQKQIVAMLVGEQVPLKLRFRLAWKALTRRI